MQQGEGHTANNLVVSTLREMSSTAMGLQGQFKDAIDAISDGLRIGRSNKIDSDEHSSADILLRRNGHPSADLGSIASGHVVDQQQHRVARFAKLLDESVVDLDALRKLAWSGIPPDIRPECWKLLLGYMPPAKSRQAASMARKRAEYMEMVPQWYDVPNSERTEEELSALRQVQVDVPRTTPSVPLFQEPLIQKGLERLLYIWGVRHPASGYVQGMNDLVTPFLAVFLGEYLPGPLEQWQPEQLTEEMLLAVEADCYWCLCKLIEGIQDHYTDSQQGIQRAVWAIKENVTLRDKAMADKLESEGVDFIQFAWRWVNCLLMREVPFILTPRLWDNYLVEGTGMRDYLVLLCVEFLLQWRTELITMEFQEIIMWLQKPPTSDWTEKELVQLLSRASYHSIDKSKMMGGEKAIEL